MLGLLPGLWILLAPMPARAEIRTGHADIQFEATSTLHDFSGSVRSEPFDCRVAWDGPAAIISATATVAVARLDTRHAKRDENMRNMFAAERFPLITGILDAARLEPPFPRQVPLRLTIRGHEQIIPATVESFQMAAGRLRFDLAWPLSLRQSRLSPPVILGFIRVGDTVRLHAQVELEPPADQAPP